MAPVGLACFDFDWSLIETDSDRFVMENLSLVLRQRLNDSPMQWTDLLNACLKEFHDQGGSHQQVIEALSKAPMDVHMIEACQLLYNSGWTLVILSDSNVVYIEEILKHYGIRHLFSTIITNPAFFDDQGRLHIHRLIPADAPPHGCTTGTCSVNICKGQEVDNILVSLCQQEGQPIGASSLRMLYVGDGQNDYCPALRMTSGQDLYFVRRGRSLERLLTKYIGAKEAIRARIVYWDSAGDILGTLQAENLTL
ncbi:hypothetical protein EDD11_007569 [Mortierella claussenii]|nr:hypothetical protein EDD11_007569 [Mortierella claussenii]